MDADDRDLIGEIFRDELGVDGPVGLVDDADLLKSAQDGTGVLFDICYGTCQSST